LKLRRRGVSRSEAGAEDESYGERSRSMCRIADTRNAKDAFQVPMGPNVPLQNHLPPRLPHYSLVGIRK